jgi:stearoyl-CoA desaturase (delta-9 desaturase)
MRQKAMGQRFGNKEVTAAQQQVPVKKVIWTNVIFFFLTTLLGTLGTCLYLLRFGISVSELLLFLFYMAVTSTSITLGYHRLFAHCTFKAHALVRFLVLFFGAAAFEQSALRWASQHRDHHRLVDSELDPYSIKKGFFYAHIGWLIFWQHPLHYENARDLRKSRLLAHQHRYYTAWSITAGILTPLVVGALTGHLLGAFLLSVCTRLTLVYHATFCINSVCHKFGKATYDIYSSAKDHWLAALITNGEGYHNYHHHFPGDYRNGVRWYQWDPTKWIIALLSGLGLAWDLRKMSKFRIIAAQLAAEKQSLEDRLLERLENPGALTFREMLQAQYEKLKQTLGDWEHAARDYQQILCQRIARHSNATKEAAVRSLEARRRFHQMLTQWKSVYLQLQAA